MKKKSVKKLRAMFPHIKIRRKMVECTQEEYKTNPEYWYLLKNGIKIQLKLF